MKDGNIEILDLDFEYKLWKNKLEFYNKELDLLKDRVDVIAKEHPEFKFEEENLITLNKQQESLKSLKNKIKTLEFEMGYYAVDYPISSRHSHYTEHEKIRTDICKINDAQQYILKHIYPTLCFPFNK